MNSIWIARDKDGELYTFKTKPHKVEDYGEWLGEKSTDAEILYFDWFPELTFENGPIELVIKEKED